MTTALKERELSTWTSVAPGWHKHDERLRACFGSVSQRMLDAAGVRAGNRVLDIATGTGEPAIPAAERVGPTGYVLGTDFVEDMLVFARRKAAARQLGHIEFRTADGEALDVPLRSFDAVLIRWGLMFMPDPIGCLRRAHAALRPGGRIAVACWAGPERNPSIAVPVGVIKRHVEVPPPAPGAPNIFAFADAERLRGALAEAGFRDVTVGEAAVANGGEFADGAAFFTFIREIAGPIARLYDQLPEVLRVRVAEEIAREVEKYRNPAGRVAVPGITWIAGGIA